MRVQPGLGATRCLICELGDAACLEGKPELNTRGLNCKAGRSGKHALD